MYRKLQWEEGFDEYDNIEYIAECTVYSDNFHFKISPMLIDNVIKYVLDGDCEILDQEDLDMEFDTIKEAKEYCEELNHSFYEDELYEEKEANKKDIMIILNGKTYKIHNNTYNIHKIKNVLNDVLSY